MKKLYSEGPWIAKHSGFGDASVFAKEFDTNTGKFEPEIVSRTSWGNALLISKAPEMFDLLSLICSQSKSSLETWNSLPIYMRARINQAELIIKNITE